VGGGKVFQKAWEDRMKDAMGGNYWLVSGSRWSGALSTASAYRS